MNYWAPHVTVAAIIEQQGKYLLVEESIRGELQLNQPAGHMDPNETILEAVIRETLEETTRHFTPEAIIGCYQWQHPRNNDTFLRITFCGTASEPDANYVLDDDIHRTLWLSQAEIQAQKARLRSPLVTQCIADFQAGNRYPLSFLSTLKES